MDWKKVWTSTILPPVSRRKQEEMPGELLSAMFWKREMWMWSVHLFPAWRQQGVWKTLWMWWSAVWRSRRQGLRGTWHLFLWSVYLWGWLVWKTVPTCKKMQYDRGREQEPVWIIRWHSVLCKRFLPLWKVHLFTTWLVCFRGILWMWWPGLRQTWWPYLHRQWDM